MKEHSHDFPRKVKPFPRTSTPLKAIPREWLREVEPYVYRLEGDECWYWVGGLTQTGRPTKYTKNAENKTVRINVVQKIAEMFWYIPKGWKAKQTCETLNCVAPEHIMIVRE